MIDYDLPVTTRGRPYYPTERDFHVNRSTANLTVLGAGRSTAEWSINVRNVSPQNGHGTSNGSSNDSSMSVIVAFFIDENLYAASGPAELKSPRTSLTADHGCIKDLAAFGLKAFDDPGFPLTNEGVDVLKF